MENNPELQHIITKIPAIWTWWVALCNAIPVKSPWQAISTLSSFPANSGAHESLTGVRRRSPKPTPCLFPLNLTYKSHGKPGNLVEPTPPPLKGVTKGNTLRKSVSVKTKLQFFKPATGKMAGSNATSYTRSLCSIMVTKDPASEKKDPFHSRIRLFWLILSCDYILSRSVSIWLFNDGLPWLGSSWTGPDSKAAVHTKRWEWGENKKVFLIISLPSLIILPITVLKQKVHWEYSERRWTGAIFDLDK